MAAVMRPADARFSASAIITSSIRRSFAGALVDCNTKTSLPRTFSWISTRTSPSEKRLTAALPIGRSRIPATARASSGLALHVNIIRRLLFIRVPATGQAAKKNRKNGVWQGGKDSNPRMPESKSGALTDLATPLEHFSVDFPLAQARRQYSNTARAKRHRENH